MYMYVKSEWILILFFPYFSFILAVLCFWPSSKNSKSATNIKHSDPVKNLYHSIVNIDNYMHDLLSVEQYLFHNIYKVWTTLLFEHLKWHMGRQTARKYTYGHTSQRLLGQSEDWTVNVMLATRTCNLWQNMLSCISQRIWRSVGTLFQPNVAFICHRLHSFWPSHTAQALRWQRCPETTNTMFYIQMYNHVLYFSILPWQPTLSHWKKNKACRKLLPRYTTVSEMTSKLFTWRNKLFT